MGRGDNKISAVQSKATTRASARASKEKASAIAPGAGNVGADSGQNAIAIKNTKFIEAQDPATQERIRTLLESSGWKAFEDGNPEIVGVDNVEGELFNGLQVIVDNHKTADGSKQRTKRHFGFTAADAEKYGSRWDPATMKTVVGTRENPIGDKAHNNNVATQTREAPVSDAAVARAAREERRKQRGKSATPSLNQDTSLDAENAEDTSDMYSQSTNEDDLLADHGL